MTKRRCAYSFLLIFILSLVFLSSVFVIPNKVYASINTFLDVKNPSFENTEMVNNKSIATDWIINNGNFDLTNVNIISNNAYDKNNYLQVENGTYNIESENFVEIENGYSYLFGVKFIFSSEDDSFSLAVKTYNANNELIDVYQSQRVISKQQLIGKWQEVFLTVNNNENIKCVKISIEADAKNGTIGIDNVYGHKNFISLYNGASISLERDVVRLRFMAKIDVSSYQTFINNYSNVSVGILFSTKDQVNSVGEFTIKGIPSNGKVQLMPIDHWNNPKTYMKDGYYTFCAGPEQEGYDELEKILNGEFVVRAYIKYTENGKEKMLYSSWNMQDNCRSISQVAQKAKQDIDVFNSYSLDQKEIINAYIEGRKPSFENLE